MAEEEDRGMQRAQVLLRLQTKAKAAASCRGPAIDLSGIPPELESPLNRGEERDRTSVPFYQACEIGTRESLNSKPVIQNNNRGAHSDSLGRGRKVPQWLASQPRIPPPDRRVPAAQIQSQRARPSLPTTSSLPRDDEDSLSNASDASFHSVESRVNDVTLNEVDEERSRAFPIRALQPGDFVEEHEAKYRTQHHGNISLKQARDLLYRISNKDVRPSAKLSYLEHLLEVDITPRLAQGLVLAPGGSMGLNTSGFSTLPALCIDMFHRFDASRDPENVQCLYKILHLLANCLGQLDSSRDQTIRVILERCEATQYDLIRGLLSVCEDSDLPEEDQSEIALSNMSAKVLYLLTNKRSMKRFADHPEKVEAMARTMLKKPHKYQQLAAVRILRELYRWRHDDGYSLPNPRESSELVKEIGDFLLVRTAEDAVYCLYYILDLMPQAHLIATFNLCRIPKVMEEVIERERYENSDIAKLARKIPNLSRQNSIMLQECLNEKIPFDTRRMNRNYTEKQWHDHPRGFEDQRYPNGARYSRDMNERKRMEEDDLQRFQGDYFKRQTQSAYPDKFSNERRGRFRDETGHSNFRPGGRGKTVKVSLADVVKNVETDYVSGNQPVRRPRPEVANVSREGGGMSSIEGDSSDSAPNPDPSPAQQVTAAKVRDGAKPPPKSDSLKPAIGIATERMTFQRGHMLTGLKKNDNVAIIDAVSRTDIDRDLLAKHICGFLNCGTNGKIMIGVKHESEYPVIMGIAMDRSERDYFRQG